MTKEDWKLIDVWFKDALKAHDGDESLARNDVRAKIDNQPDDERCAALFIIFRSYKLNRALGGSPFRGTQKERK